MIAAPSLRVLSLGAGVQSSTLALMAARDELPRPDCAIFADTGWEPQEVYRWLSWLEEQLPYPVYRVRRPGRDLGEHAIAVATGEQPRQGSCIPPWFSRDEAGRQTGMLPKQCTKEFKSRAVTRQIRMMVGLAPRERAPADLRVEQWLGISTDEMQRMKRHERPWIENTFPLIDLRMKRSDCIGWMQARGYPKPPKSSCVFCPYRGNEQWRDMRDNHPRDWQQVIAFDEAIRPGFPGMKGQAFVHRSGKPLSDVDLAPTAPGQTDMFMEECDGGCGV